MIWFQIIPNAVEDEEELDEDATEGQDAAHNDARQGFGEEWLLRNLAWDLVCSHWWLDALLKQENKNTPTFMISHMTACQKNAHTDGKRNNSWFKEILRNTKIRMWKSIKIWEPIIKCHFLVSTCVESAPVRMPGIKNVLCWKTLKNLVYWRRHTHCFFETEVCTHKSERNGDAKPQCQDGHECTKGNSSGGALYPQDQIRQEEVHKYNPAKT